VGGSQREEGVWTALDRRYWPGDTFGDHLTFALRHEDLDLLVLKRVFEAVPRAQIEAMVRAAPTGVPARRAWQAAPFKTSPRARQSLGYRPVLPSHPAH
jgi:hypothetical protein